jgi:hypothetical protein
MSINNSLLNQSPGLARLFRQKSIEIPKIPPHPPQTLAAQFKRPYRNCPDHTDLLSPHFCFGAVPIGIYRFWIASGWLSIRGYRVLARIETSAAYFCGPRTSMSPSRCFEKALVNTRLGKQSHLARYVCFPAGLPAAYCGSPSPVSRPTQTIVPSSPRPLPELNRVPWLHNIVEKYCRGL